MKDPILDKLASDAGVVLADLWRMVNHQPSHETQEWSHPWSRAAAAKPAEREAEAAPPSQSALCYFHLN